ncbi:hypothetical protein Hanom_Chr08g00749061 [Helianthus anomalus]
MHYGSSAMSQALRYLRRMHGDTTGSSQAQGSYHGQGSFFHPQGSSQVPGSRDYPPRPPFPVFQGSNVSQDQGSLRSLQHGSSDVHQGDFIPMQTIASSGPSIIPESRQYELTSGIPNLNPQGGITFNNSYKTNHGLM